MEREEDQQRDHAAGVEAEVEPELRQDEEQSPEENEAEADAGEEDEEEEEEESTQLASTARAGGSAGGPPPPPGPPAPPGPPPPLPDWLQRSIAGVPPTNATASSSSSSSPAPVEPLDLAAMIAGGRQLRATVVVEKQVVETPQDELRRALTRRMSSKAMAKKDEITDLVAKLKDGRFRTFDDLARVVQNAVRVQNEVGNIELIKMAHWPLDLLNSLKLVVSIVHNISVVDFVHVLNIRRNIKRTEDALRDQANKGLVVNEQAVSNIRDCVRVLRETGPNLEQAERILGALTVSVPLHKEAALAKTNSLIESAVNVVFELALSKYKQPIPRNSFNLRYRLNHTISLLQTAISLCREAGIEAKEKRERANQAVLDMQHKYADVLEINAVYLATETDASDQATAATDTSSALPVQPGSLSSSDSAPAPTASLTRSGTGLAHSSGASRFPLHSYISEGLIQKVSAFVSGLKEAEGDEKVLAELAKEDNRARTPMEVAILQSDVRAVRELLSLCSSSSPSVASFFASYRNGEGNTYAHLAASLPSAASSSSSSLSSSSPSSPSPSMATTILCALVDGLAAQAESPGVLLSSHLNDRGETPLHCAAKIGNADAVRYLVELGVPVSGKDKFGRDALSLLALKCIERVTVAPPRQAGGDRSSGLPGLNRYFMNASLSDVVFNVRGALFPAHRIILCAQSPNFKSMLENKEWKEAQNAEVRLEDMNPVAFKHLLEHLYCGDTSFTTADLDLALDILHAADRFLVDSMKSKCEHVLFKMLTLENAFLLYTRASLHSARQLREATAHFILVHYDEIAFADEDRAVLLDILRMCGASAA